MSISKEELLKDNAHLTKERKSLQGKFTRYKKNAEKKLAKSQEDIAKYQEELKYADKTIVELKQKETLFKKYEKTRIKLVALIKKPFWQRLFLSKETLQELL